MTDKEIIDIGRSFPRLTHLLIENLDQITFVSAVRACLATQAQDSAAILQAATRDAPSADAVDAQRWRYFTTHNATCSVEHMEQLIDGLMAENAASLAASAPKEST